MTTDLVNNYNAASDFLQNAETILGSNLLSQVVINRLNGVIKDQDKADYFNAIKSGLSSVQEELTLVDTGEFSSFTQSEKLSPPGALYGNEDEVVSPGVAEQASFSVMHPNVLDYDIPVAGSTPKPGYLMFYIGQDTSHSHLMACQGLAPQSFTKHVNVLSVPNIGESNEFETSPQQIAYPFVMKYSNSVDPLEYKYLIFYASENQNIDGTLDSTCDIRVVKWTGEINPDTGDFTYNGNSTIDAVSIDVDGNKVFSSGDLVLEHTAEVPSLYAPYAEYEESTGIVHIWYTGLDAQSATSAIYYTQTTIANLTAGTPSLVALSPVPFISLQRGSDGLIAANESIFRKDGSTLSLGNHCIAFKGKLLARGSRQYRHCWLSVEAFSEAGDSEYICLHAITPTEVITESYNPSPQIHSIVGDKDDFSSAISRCYAPAVYSVNGEDTFYTWWTSGSESKSFIAFAGNKTLASKYWAETPASVVFNEMQGQEAARALVDSSNEGQTNNFYVFKAGESSAEVPMNIPEFPISLTVPEDIYNFDIDKSIKMTTQASIDAKEPIDSSISSSKFDSYTGRSQQRKDVYLEGYYVCKPGDTLDRIASLYYKDYIKDDIPFGVIQYAGMISSVNGDIDDIDITPGLKLNIPDPRELK